MNGTATMTDYDQRARDMMAEIAELAPRVKSHKLASWMVDGSKQLSYPQARMVVMHLQSQLPAPPVESLRQGIGPVAVSRETSAPGQPVKTVPPAMAAFDFPAGYYATPSITGNNDLDFWRIDRPAKGKWAGRTFVKRVVGGGAGDEMQTFQLENMQQRLACQSIVDTGIDESQALFADNLDRCVDCGRALTDEISRAEKRGPTCRSRLRR